MNTITNVKSPSNYYRNVTGSFILGSNERPITFLQLKPKLMNLLMNALQIETDPQNTHMLLGGLFLCVQDSAVYEKVEQVTQPSTETSSNLLSSGEQYFS